MYPEEGMTVKNQSVAEENVDFKLSERFPQTYRSTKSSWRFPKLGQQEYAAPVNVSN